MEKGGSIKSFPECFSYNTKSSLKHTPPSYIRGATSRISRPSFLPPQL